MNLYLTRFAAGVIFLLGFNQFALQAEINDSLLSIENQLLIKYNAVLAENPFQRNESAMQFYNDFCSYISNDESLEHPLDTFDKIGKIYSPDHRIRIYTWNIPVGLDENLYFGIIQYYSKTDNRYQLLKLNDGILFGPNMDTVQWQAALYFQIIESKHAGQKYYTLFGFNFNNSLSNKKTIEIISIDELDHLYYCENLIYFEGKTQSRIEFEYNEKAVMSLRYDENKKMIIFDHLTPSRPSLKGKYEFYGPDFTYDGLKFEKGIWVHYSNIEITN